MVGLDSHPGMLAAARGHAVELVEGDMRAFDLGRTFDRVLIPYTGLYCLPDDEAVVSCLECVARHLTPDGRLLFDGYLVDPELEAGACGPDWLTSVHDGEVRVDVYERSEHDPATRRFTVTYIHVVHGDDGTTQHSYTLDHHYLGSEDASALLSAAELRTDGLWGDFDDGPLTPDSERLVVRARKA